MVQNCPQVSVVMGGVIDIGEKGSKGVGVEKRSSLRWQKAKGVKKGRVYV